MDVGPSGDSPASVLVDDAGTAHIVWSEFVRQDVDITHYCRLKRGASTCDNPPATRALIVPGGPEDRGSGPAVIAVNDRLVVLSERCCGNGATGVVAWISEDGGDSFSGPGVLGSGPMERGQAVVFGPPNAPHIAVFGSASGEGPAVQTLTPGRFTTSHAVLPRGPIPKGLAVAGGRLFAAASYEQPEDSDAVQFSAWSGQGDPNDGRTWSTARIANAIHPRLAGGTGGLYMVTQGGPGLKSLQVRHGGSDGRFGAPTTLDTFQQFYLPFLGNGQASSDVFEDATGRAVVGYVPHTVLSGDSRARFVIRSTTNGSRYSSPQVIAQAPDIHWPRVSAAFDGGGVMTGINRDSGRAFASSFGSLSSTGRPGLGNKPGGGLPPDVKSDCAGFKIGALRVAAREGCLFGVEGHPATKVSEGTIALNGLEIVPDPNVKIKIDAAQRTLDTNGPVTVQVRGLGVGAIPLWKGELSLRLPTRVGEVVGPLPQSLSSIHPNIKGFPVTSDLDKITLTADGVSIPLSLALPGNLGGVTGQVVLKTNLDGLKVDSVAFHVDEAPIGPVLLSNLNVSYSSSIDEWRGSGKFEFPPAPGGWQVDIRLIRFQGGRFKEADLYLVPPYPGIPVYTDVFLGGFGGGLGLDPLKITGTATIGVMPINPGAGTAEGRYLVAVDGTVSATFGDPFRLELKGDGFVVGENIVSADAIYSSDGFYSVSAQAGLDFKVASADVSLGASYNGHTHFFVGKGHGDVKILGYEVAGGDVLMSSAGAGACITTLGITAWFRHDWRTGDTDKGLSAGSCNLSEFEAPPAFRALARSGRVRAAQTGPGIGFQVPPNVPDITLKLAGAGAPPQVILVDPAGHLVFPQSARNAAAGGRAYAGVDPSTNTTQVALPQPIPGAWRLVTNPGSSTITNFQQATGQAPPTASARVGGRGRTRLLSFTATQRPGISTTFYELTRNGPRIIATTTKARGKVRFRVDGPGGRRPIHAAISSDGLPELDTEVASYVAPAPIRLARPRPVTITRAGGGIRVKWARVPNAASYSVRVRLSDGRRLFRLLSSRLRSLRIPGVRARTRITVTVAARTSTGHEGRRAITTLKL